MTAILGIGFFLGVLGIAIWSIVATVRPRLGRMLFLLEHGPIFDAGLPQPARVTLRGRTVPMRVTRSGSARAVA